MPAQVNPEIFHAKVYDIARLIPHGLVTSYGHIARLAGHPAHSRLVGAALKFLPDGSDVPWHRVLSSSGAISDRGDGGEGAARQAHRLQQEGVTVSSGRGEGVTIDFGHPNPNAKYKVNLRQFGWFPDQVHLEGYDDDDEDDNEEGQQEDGQRHQRIVRLVARDYDQDSDLTDLSDEDS